MREAESSAPSYKEQTERFHKLLGALEDLLDSGFFVSMLGRVVIDEKRAFALLNELRTLDFNVAPQAPEARTPRKAPETADETLRQAYSDAETIRRGADEYARRVLEEMELQVEKTLVSIREGQRILKERLEKIER